MGVVAALKRTIISGDDQAAAIERELVDLRAGIASDRAEALRLGAEWLRAGSQTEAEEHDRRRREYLRIVERDEARLPGLEARLVEARAATQRGALARHRKVIALIYPRLKAALENAADVQVEAMRAREAAVADLGEGAVALHIPAIGYKGLLFKDLIALWAAKQDRVWGMAWSPPKPAASRPAIPAGPPARSEIGHRLARTGAAAESPQAAAMTLDPPTPKAPRPLRDDPRPTAGSGMRLIEFRRSNSDLDGFQVRRGDRIAVPERQAEALVRNSAAIFLDEEPKQ